MTNVNMADLGLQTPKQEVIRARVSRDVYSRLERFRAENGLRMSDVVRLAAAQLVGGDGNDDI